MAPKGDCPVPAEDSRVVNRLAAGSFPFREDASKGRKRSGRGIYDYIVKKHGPVTVRAQAFRKGYLPFVAGIFVPADDARNIC
ncbi:hypothetical protein B4135_2265 [Caldibacillus debilis]|uniref:Uncharacterized protein n=1 Tax=Caldibacillus debilis TaxID=301148 RepID=A0A150M241_9BACI|nr:hypothetical protein B4135_2265 [Caldibacillus debilis]